MRGSSKQIFDSFLSKYLKTYFYKGQPLGQVLAIQILPGLRGFEGFRVFVLRLTSFRCNASGNTAKKMQVCSMQKQEVPYTLTSIVFCRAYGSSLRTI